MLLLLEDAVQVLMATPTANLIAADNNKNCREGD